MILDRIENWKHSAGLGAGLARGLELLAGGGLDELAEGKHELDGDRLYASVQVYRPKAPEAGRWEAHRIYADIQYMVSGCEAMGYSPAGALRAAGPYDEKKDVIFFEGGAEAGSLLKVEAGMFAVFFPADAHRPSLAWDGQAPALVKKIVLKVRLL